MSIKLICFDVDGTLVDDTIFIWDTLHDAFQVPKEIRKYYFDAFKNGEITYDEWFDSDLEQWKDRKIHRNDFVREVNRLKLMAGAKETLSYLKRKGYVLGVISGSLDVVIDVLFPEHPFEELFINRLSFDLDGFLTGGVATPYDLECKALGLREMASKYGFDVEECAFVGDHYNDVEVAKLAGKSIAFNSKSELLDEAADIRIEGQDLSKILKYF